MSPTNFGTTTYAFGGVSINPRVLKCSIDIRFDFLLGFFGVSLLILYLNEFSKLFKISLSLSLDLDLSQPPSIRKDFFFQFFSVEDMIYDVVIGEDVCAF